MAVRRLEKQSCLPGVRLRLSLLQYGHSLGRFYGGFSQRASAKQVLLHAACAVRRRGMQITDPDSGVYRAGNDTRRCAGESVGLIDGAVPRRPSREAAATNCRSEFVHRAD